MCRLVSPRCLWRPTLQQEAGGAVFGGIEGAVRGVQKPDGWADIRRHSRAEAWALHPKDAEEKKSEGKRLTSDFPTLSASPSTWQLGVLPRSSLITLLPYLE